MKTLKGKEGYCYADVEWGMTREETEKAAGVELTEFGVPTLLKTDREATCRSPSHTLKKMKPLQGVVFIFDYVFSQLHYYCNPCLISSKYTCVQ